MQINNKVNAYILVWAIFLSVIILISFLSITSKINKTINNYDPNKNNYSLNKIMKDKDFSTKNLWNGEEIIFEDNNIYIKSLKQNQNTEVRIQNTSNVAFNLKINKWWPIFYNFLVFSWATFSWTLSNSWIVNNSLNFTWSFNSKYNNWIIYIKNLGWYTNFELTSSSKLTKEFENYNIVKKIWNKSVVKKVWSIKIFDLWIFPWIDYNKYGLRF